MTPMLRNLIIAGVFVLCLWQAGEGDYQMLRCDLQKEYDELLARRGA